MSRLIIAVLATSAVAAQGMPGGPCNAAKVCMQGYACVTGQIDTCQPIRTVPGTSCRDLADTGNLLGMRESQCGNNMVCAASIGSGVAGVCAAPVSRGGRCDYDVIGAGMICEDGLECHSGFCQVVRHAESEECDLTGNPKTSMLCGMVNGEQMHCSNMECSLSAVQTCGVQDNGEYKDCADYSVDSCVAGLCRPLSKDGMCNPNKQDAISDQSYCPGRQYCLSVHNGHKCFTDRCYNSCAAGTTCTDGMCVTDTPCHTHNDACCQPQHNVLEGSTLEGVCRQEIRDCVCDFDPKCCATTLDEMDSENQPGWDYQCIAEAEKYCFLRCDSGLM